jgi:hypothetical protein
LSDIRQSEIQAGKLISSWRSAAKGRDAAQWFLATGTLEDDRQESHGARWRRGRIEQGCDFLEVSFGGGAEPAGVPHAMEPFWQNVLEETAQELFCR